MSNINKKTSWFALVISHMCGMIDLAALPVWVGTLIAAYAFLPAEAGLIVTLFLVGAVLCSLVFAPRFHKLNGRVIAPICFWISAACFLAMTQFSAFAGLAVLHFIAGCATGLAVSLTHGSMGKTSNPHRLFALGGFALGIAAMIYLGATPEIVKATSREALFVVFAVIMGFAALVATVMFPKVELAAEGPRPKFSRPVWLLIIGTVFFALNNSLILSFAERAGDHRGFTFEQIQTALITMSILAIISPILSAVLQKRLNARVVVMIGVIVHGLLCLGIMTATDYPLFIGTLMFLPAVIVFTHPFVFDALAQLEPTGRAVAATPAMIMSGSAIGPFLGGAVVQTMGYDQLGYLAVIFAIISVAFLATGMRAAMEHQTNLATA